MNPISAAHVENVKANHSAVHQYSTPVSTPKDYRQFFVNLYGTPCKLAGKGFSEQLITGH